MSLTTALSLCTSRPALMGLSPSNCPTGDAENDKQTHIHSNALTIHRDTQTRADTDTGTNQQTKGNAHKCLDG